MVQIEIDDYGEFINLRDYTDDYVERKWHKPGIIGTIWIDKKTQQRMYQPLGGKSEGEGAPVSVEVLKEVIRIMETPLEDLRRAEQEKLRVLRAEADNLEREARGEVPIFDANKLVEGLSKETKDLLVGWQDAMLRSDYGELFELGHVEIARKQDKRRRAKEALLAAIEPEIIELTKHACPQWDDLQIDENYFRIEARSQKLCKAENELLKISLAIAVLFPRLSQTIH